MARRRKSKEQGLVELVVPVVGIIVFIAWAVPSIWVIIKPFVFFATFAGILFAGFVLYRMLHPPRSNPHLEANTAPRPQRRRSEFRREIPTTSLVDYSSATREAELTPVSSTIQQQPDVQPIFCEETLRRMDWLGFEHLVVDLFEALEFKATKTSAGADGGIDIELRSKTAEIGSKPKAFVQCKARSLAPVGVDKVRELLGVITVNGVSRGVLVTNSGFTDDARAFASSTKSLQVGDIQWLLKTIEMIPNEKRHGWEIKHFRPGFDIPSCVACEVKMVLRQGSKGAFWGCPNFGNSGIRCRSTMQVRRFERDRLAQVR